MRLARALRERLDTSHRRPLVIGWTTVGARMHELAAAIDGDAYVTYPWSLSRRRLAPVRYLVSTATTTAELLRRRPSAVIASNPPVIPALLAYPYSLVTGAPLVLDSHPASFGLRPSTPGRLLLPLHRWLTPRVRATMVVSQPVADIVEGWRGRPIIFHEAPPLWDAGPMPPLDGRLQVLVVFRLTPDEPLAEVLEAARACPDVDFRITGDTRRVDRAVVATAPANVEFTGFLRGEGYVDAIRRTHVMMALTRDAFSVPRSACEAVHAGRRLITSDTPVCRSTFPEAAWCTPDSASIAAALRRVAAG